MSSNHLLLYSRHVCDKSFRAGIFPDQMKKIKVILKYKNWVKDIFYITDLIIK